MGSSLSTRLWLVGRPTGLHGITGCFDVGHWAKNSERQLPILTQHWNLYQLELRAAALIHYTGLQKLNIFYWLRKRERKKEEKQPEGIITTSTRSTNTSPRMVSHLELYGEKKIPFQTWSHLTFLQFDYFQPKMVTTLHCTCRLHSTLLWRRKSLIKFINLHKTSPIFRQNYNLLNVLSCEISGFNNYGKCAQFTR